MVQYECLERIQKLKPPLGSLLQINTFESSIWTKEIPKTSCHIVLPYSQFETKNYEINPSVHQVSVGDEIDETHGHCRSPLMVVDMITKSNCNHIATSLGLELQDEDQDDDIGYMKEDLVCYIEEVGNYGFDHIIVIGECYRGLLFMDCFGHVFDLDSMGNVLWLLGDYSKRVERVTKGLKTGRGHHGL